MRVILNCNRTAMATSSVRFPYAWLGNREFNPSMDLTFSGELVCLVLIRGSNLDRPIEDGGIDLIRAGFQRYSVTWVRELTDKDNLAVGEAGPAIDSIPVVEFESHSELNEWLNEPASAFLR